MSARLSAAAAGRPRAALAAVALAAVVLAVIASGAGERLGVSGLTPSGSQSAAAAARLRTALGHDAEADLLLVTRGRVSARSAVYGVALRTIATQLRTDPAVAVVRRGPVGRDGHTTALEVFLRGDAAARERAAGRIQANLDPGPLRVLYGGRVEVLRTARQRIRHELGRLELLVLPLTLLLLVGALGLRVAVAPVLAGAVGVLAAAASLRLASGVAETSVLGAAPGAAIGLAVGLDASLSIASRYRDEAWAFGRGESALGHAAELAAPSVALAACAAAAVSALGWLLPLGYAHSMALSGAVAALLAGLAALVATPAALALAGHALRGRPPPSAFGRGGRLYRLAGLVGSRRPLAAALGGIALVALLAATVPALRFDSVSLAPRELPQGAEARRADARLAAVLGPGGASPLLVTGAPQPTERLVAYARRVGRVPGVVSARVRPAGGPSLIEVHARPRPGSVAAQDVVRSVRATARPLAPEVGGESAVALDARERAVTRLPLVAALAFAILFGATALAGRGNPVRSAVTSLLALLPAAAAAGLLVLVFGDGRLDALLGYTPAGAPHLTAAVAALLAIAAISAQRSTALAAALWHERRLGSARERMTARAVALTLPGQAVAAAIVAAAAAVLAGSLILPAKEFGLAVAAGTLLDLALVRLLAAPAVAALIER